MGASYHQFCPVSKAMELLDERWTMLVVRELVTGSRHFNELRRGLPRMSPALLSRRLQQLARAGIVEKRVSGGEVVYVLTPAGIELRGVVESIGAWGTRWIGEIGEEDLDPQLLLWDIHRNIDYSAVLGASMVVKFTFPEVPPKAQNWWLVIGQDETDVCDFDPGYEVSVTVVGRLRAMTEIWRGDRAWDHALRTGAIELEGSRDACRLVPRLFTLSPFAAVPRPPTAKRVEPTG